MITKPDIILISLSTIITLLISLIIIGWLYPSLLGISDDLALVQISEEEVPYFEVIFDNNDLNSDKIILPDPLLKGRGKQLMDDLAAVGPHDLLGFRNYSVPSKADIIIIGDSQTYGNNAFIWDNWPHIFEKKLPSYKSVYTMATGGWGAIQYFYAFAKSLAFQPEIVIVAFYTGNDALESFQMAKVSSSWNILLDDKSLTTKGLPKVSFPASESEQWKIEFDNNISTIFTPNLRHNSNISHPAVDAGYKIMLDIAKLMTEKSDSEGIKIFFTIIPTKEYVYAKKIDTENIQPGESYSKLILDEKSRIDTLIKQITTLKSNSYIDVINDLQTAALQDIQLYPEDINGHPINNGYKVIADAIYRGINKYIDTLNQGFYLYQTVNSITNIIYINDGFFWKVNNTNISMFNLNLDKLDTISPNYLGNISYAGELNMDNYKDIVK